MKLRLKTEILHSKKQLHLWKIKIEWKNSGIKQQKIGIEKNLSFMKKILGYKIFFHDKLVMVLNPAAMHFQFGMMNLGSYNIGGHLLGFIEQFQPPYK